MAGSINDIGTALEPMNAPPLTLWQQAVVAVLEGSDAPLSARFLALTGGTLSGALTVDGDVIANWISARFGLDVSGYRITWVGDPTAEQDAANKRYVDSRIWYGTQVEYNAISPHDPTVLYVVLS